MDLVERLQGYAVLSGNVDQFGAIGDFFPGDNDNVAGRSTVASLSKALTWAMVPRTSASKVL